MIYCNKPRRKAVTQPELGFSSRMPHIGRMTDQSTIERAFALARSGRCASVAEIRSELKRERFDNVEAHLAGPSLARQLRGLCEAARASETAQASETA
jgi:hypothetical protein